VKGAGEAAPPGASDAYVALGSNLGDRAARLAFALRSMRQLPGTLLMARSRIYETQPVGPPPQAPYLNAVVLLRTRLPPRELLQHLLGIEARVGRVRGRERNRPRSLDLDLLLYADLCLQESDLQLPHPRLAERPFVLEPLRELAPRLTPPSLPAAIEQLAARVRDPRAVWVWEGTLPEDAGSREEGVSPSSGPLQLILDSEHQD
jgi:2-amino-4-hydroxy-6-hydroxymethyldihydropteridine diphosphokinase